MATNELQSPGASGVPGAPGTPGALAAQACTSEFIADLFRTDGDPVRIGRTLVRTLAAALPDHRERDYRFDLYVHEDLRDRYAFAGGWKIERSAGDRIAEEPESYQGKLPERPRPGELFIPMECDEGILGFGVLRAENGLNRHVSGYESGHESGYESGYENGHENGNESRNRDGNEQHGSSDGEASADFGFDAEEVVALGRLVGQALLRRRELRREDFYRSSLGSATRYLEAILSATGDAVLLVDRAGRILVANEAVEDVLGCLPLDLTGRSLRDALPSESALALLTATQLAGNQSVPVAHTLRLVRSDGRVIHVDVFVEKVHVDPEGSPGILLCLRSLEHLAVEDWFERDLRRQEKVFSRLSRSLHAPMAAFRGYLWLLRDELESSGRIPALFGALDQQAEWMQAQLETLTLMDEFRSGTSSWKDRPISPRVLFERAEGRVRSRLHACQVEVVHQIQPQSSWLRLDVDKWILALSYLLAKAAESIGGPGRLYVSEPPSADGKRLQYAIDAVAVHPDRRRPRRGAPAPEERIEVEFSYGLPLARSVVHHYGGTLLWDLKPGEPPSIHVTLPLSVATFGESSRETA